MSTDSELLRRYDRESSEAAFAELVQRHLSLVYSTALRHVGGDAHLAQDVAQTVFTALARKASSLSGRATLAGWLYLGAHHAAVQAVRARHRRHVREQEAHAMNELCSSYDWAADWALVRPELDAALRELNEADREMVLLRHFEQRPFAEIGRTFRLSDDAARMRVERALEKLRAQLKRRGIASTAAALAAIFANQAIVAAPAGLAATITHTALATAATGGVTVAAATAFMNKITFVAAAAAVVASGIAVYQTRELHRSEDARAALEQDHGALAARLREAESRIRQAEHQRTLLAKDLETAFSKNASASTPVSVSRGKTDGNLALENGATIGFYALPASSDPEEARRQLRKVNGEGIDATYAALYRQLGWDAAQRERFKNHMLDNRELSSELFRAAARAERARNPGADRAALQDVADATSAQAHAEWKADLRKIYGDTTADSIVRYQETIPVRPIANQLATALFDSTTPLTTEQADRMVKLLVAHARRNEQGVVDHKTIDIDAVLLRASSVLSPPQVEALRRVFSTRERELKLAAGSGK